MRRNSHCPSAPSSVTMPTKTAAGAHATIQMNAGRSTAVLSTRLARPAEPRPFAASAGGESGTFPEHTSSTACLDLAEPTVPALELRDGEVQVARAEVRPELGRDQELGVGDLPQEEVRDPH